MYQVVITVTMDIMVKIMIEMHCHLLPNVDDGSSSFEESIELIKKLKDIGVEKIIITPHYIRSTKYNVDNKEKYEIFLELKDKLKEQNIDIELFLGNEIFLDEYTLDDLKQGLCCTMNSSKYVLVEIPRNDVINNLDSLLFKLTSKGIIPIMAHPERYIIVQENKEVLNKWVDAGILLQVNYESINGKYGKYAKKMAKYILKNNLASFIASDVHHPNSEYFTKFDKNKKSIIKIIGEEKYSKLTYTNPLKVINNEKIN